MKILSYNLLKNKAAGELEKLYSDHRPDALCLQEVNTNGLPKHIGHMELAVSTQENRLGLALYVDTVKYSIEEVDSFGLKRSVYDKIASPAHERLLGVRAAHRVTGDRFAVGSFHASPLTALNSIRRDQIHNGLVHLQELGEGSPLMMIGDFNYPIFRRRLEQEMANSGWELFTADSSTYRNYKFYKGFFDFAAGKHFHFESMKTLQRGISDHLPIMFSGMPLRAPA